ncbi:TetR/AcrR family transcriptional regulator [Amycolatopsis mongoliensis]|uniref:TetR/AcrR family transcriptional regulator n=1 Tax=Amycolatopsis mongoliensis TaxID=715475 RepID=A0A9Y2JIR7_9PSEU|nr:TetR/AcrR family transcriptional regulator [Amycolatopsis sp. 4-36]WIX98479.1 TetR/AcrR family transcriptional regulator [Amycolatopsis sp. 4-36]
MSGRKQFDVDEVVAKAMVVFWGQGYADASLDLLTAATGLGRGSLYGAFGDKDGLFRRALDHYSATYGERYEEALTAHADDPVQAIDAFFGVTLARIEDPAVPDGCLIAQSALLTPVLTPGAAAHVRRLLDAQRTRLVAAFASAGAGAGAGAGELDDLATYVLAINQSLAVLSRAGATRAELLTVTRLASETVAARLNR